ncbi:MAG: GldG family protein [Anaerolineae bacterium]|jgi:hypothetical protein|nr:GldG family protein [Anaerolineae bacterium]
MSTPNTSPTTTPETETSAPLFPPGLLLIVAGAGFLVALLHLLTQPTFGVVGWGGLALGVLTLFVWVIMAPEQAASILTGRSAQYGGTAIVVTTIVLVALVLVYVVIRNFNISQDVSNFEVFSLTDDARSIVRTLAADPTTPPMQIIGFFSAARASEQDRISVLLDDFATTSGGRISYEFIDPDRQPLIAERYAARDRQFIIVPLGADGEPQTDQAQTASGSDQQQILDALVRASSSGDFRVYYPALRDAVALDDSGPEGASILSTELSESYGWTTTEISLLDAENPLLTPPTPAPDGAALVLIGGSTPLTAEELTVVTDYLNQGGDLVLFAGLNPDGGPALATDPALSDYLFQNYGLRFRSDIVLDLNNAILQTAFEFIAADFPADQFITREYSNETDSLLFSLTRSIDIAPEALPNVQVTVLSRTTPAGYARPDSVLLAELSPETLAQTPEDLTGAIPVAAVAENTQTGSRVVLFGSTAIAQNAYRQLDSRGVRNTDAARRALFWATGYDAYRQIPSLELVRPEQVPLLLTDTQQRTVAVITLLLLPFGVLGLGLWQWWVRRERTAA